MQRSSRPLFPPVGTTSHSPYMLTFGSLQRCENVVHHMRVFHNFPSKNSQSEAILLRVSTRWPCDSIPYVHQAISATRKQNSSWACFMHRVFHQSLSVDRFRSKRPPWLLLILAAIMKFFQIAPVVLMSVRWSGRLTTKRTFPETSLSLIHI